MAKVDDLAETVRALVAPGKGILAADESGGTIERRFAAVGIESTEENRRAYRELLLTTAGAGQWISGVILFDETIRQRAADGTSLPEVLERQGIIPGIKVDQGAEATRARRSARRSRRVSTACASASRSTASSEHASPSGARSSRSAMTFRASTASG